MRLTFAILVLLLIAVTIWAIWVELRPDWRRYQDTLYARAESRLVSELAAARDVLERPEVQDRLSTIDARLAAWDSDTTEGAERRRTLRSRLTEIRNESTRLRSRLRHEETRLWTPEVARPYRAALSLLERAQKAYSDASGEWPQDPARLDSLKARCDSLSEVAQRFVLRLETFRTELDHLREEERLLRLETAVLTAERDSLQAERRRILRPVELLGTELQRVRARRPGIQEIASPDGGEIARCPTCHGDLRGPPGAHPPLVANGSFVDVPCTACHRGDGRALDIDRAHRGLLTAAGRGAGPFSLQGRIDRLSDPNPTVRRETLEDLRLITGIDPGGAVASGGDADSAAAAAWLEWWTDARRYFETGEGSTDSGDPERLLAAGIDPWVYSAEGRPLQYVGSQECLSCHETLHREHSERWKATKFKSMERLKDEPNPEKCYECHATGYDPASGTFAEPGVTCEGCHGPGERYSEMMFVGKELAGRGDTVRGNALLDLSSRLSRDAVSLRLVEGDYGPINLCVKCHHPKRHAEGGPGILERIGVADSTDQGATD